MPEYQIKSLINEGNFIRAIRTDGFSAWKKMYATSIKMYVTSRIPLDLNNQEETKIFERIKAWEGFKYYDPLSSDIIFTAFEAASVCQKENNLATSNNLTDKFPEICEKIKSNLPDNLKADILSEILLKYRSSIRLPERIQNKAEAYAAIIDEYDKGDIIKIGMSIVSNGSGLFYPDPYAAYIKIRGDNFQDALKDVAQSCGLTCWTHGMTNEPSADPKRDFDVRWSLLELKGTPFYNSNGIGGPSLGGAMYTLCHALMEDAGKALPEPEKV